MARLRGKEALGKVTDVSPLNFSNEIRKDMSLPRKVRLHDMALREGRQMEGVLLRPDACVHVAELLDDLGVPTIQMPYGQEYKAEMELMKALSKMKLKADVEVCIFDNQQGPDYSWTKLNKSIDEILEFGFIPWLCVAMGDRLLKGFAEFSGVKNKSIEYLREKELENTVKAIRHAKDRGGRISANVQDPMRCDLNHMEKFVKGIADAGIDYFNFDDIAGPGIPAVYKYVTRRAKKVVPDTPMGIYVHDDYGFGLGAALAAIEGGGEIMHSVVNGYGKRGGMLDTLQTAAVLEFMYGIDTGIKLEKMYDVSREIADIYRQPLPTARAITGRSAYRHGGDWHTQFSHNVDFPGREHRWVVEAIDPELVGQKTGVTLAVISGPVTIRAKADMLGIELSIDQARRVWKEARQWLTWRCRPIEDEEFLKIVRRVVPGIPMP